MAIHTSIPAWRISDSIAWQSTVHGVHGVAESDTTEPLTQAKFTLSRLQTLIYQFCSYSYLSLIFCSNKDPHLRGLLLGRKVMTNLDSIFKSRDISLPTKVRLVKAMVFPVTPTRTSKAENLEREAKASCLLGRRKVPSSIGGDLRVERDRAILWTL